MNFQCENTHLTRFILREISLDTQIVREIMSTYLVKERYYFTKIVEIGDARQKYNKFNANYFILQLKGLLSMPFLNSEYISEVLPCFSHMKSILRINIYTEIFDWIESVLVAKDNGT